MPLSSITPLHGSPSLACAAHIPRIDGLFVAALLASALLNWAATLLSTDALARADASLVSPLLTFNPAFTLLLAWPALGEVPGLRQTTGVAVLLLGRLSHIMVYVDGKFKLANPLVNG